MHFLIKSKGNLVILVVEVVVVMEVEVGVDGRAVVGEVEKVSWSVGHVVVGKGLGGGKCGGRVVDNVLVRRVGGKDLGNQEEQYFY